MAVLRPLNQQEVQDFTNDGVNFWMFSSGRHSEGYKPSEYVPSAQNTNPRRAPSGPADWLSGEFVPVCASNLAQTFARKGSVSQTRLEIH
jgi:hypothetical protein